MAFANLNYLKSATDFVSRNLHIHSFQANANNQTKKVSNCRTAIRDRGGIAVCRQSGVNAAQTIYQRRFWSILDSVKKCNKLLLLCSHCVSHDFSDGAAKHFPSKPAFMLPT